MPSCLGGLRGNRAAGAADARRKGAGPRPPPALRCRAPSSGICCACRKASSASAWGTVRKPSRLPGLQSGRARRCFTMPMTLVGTNRRGPCMPCLASSSQRPLPRKMSRWRCTTPSAVEAASPGGLAAPGAPRSTKRIIIPQPFTDQQSGMFRVDQTGIPWVSIPRVVAVPCPATTPGSALVDARGSACYTGEVSGQGGLRNQAWRWLRIAVFGSGAVLMAPGSGVPYRQTFGTASRRPR